MSPSRQPDRQPAGPSRYAKLIEAVFFHHYTRGDREVTFKRADLEEAAAQLGIELPKNLGDLVYSFRYRTDLPPALRELLGPDEEWVIRAGGRSVYRMCIERDPWIRPGAHYAQISVPDGTPGLIRLHARGDEQALLAIIRYNRLLDIFLRIACYSLQSHLRTTVRGVGQVETDEMYVGIDRRGAHYVVPVQAKGGKDRLGIVQIEQDFAVCDAHFSELICRPVGAQFVEPNLIALFEFQRDGDGRVSVLEEKHYRLVPGDAFERGLLAGYRAEPA